MNTLHIHNESRAVLTDFLVRGYNRNHGIKGVFDRHRREGRMKWWRSVSVCDFRVEEEGWESVYVRGDRCFVRARRIMND